MVIDYDYLEDLGVADIDQETADKAVGQVQAIYAVRLGIAIGDKLSDEQLDEFDNIKDNPEIFMPWVAERVPDYEDIADDVFFSLKEELSKTHLEVLGV